MQRKWGDGRVLSDIQRQRKREADKLRQRTSRTRNAALLDRLQTVVEHADDDNFVQMPRVRVAHVMGSGIHDQPGTGVRSTLDEMNSNTCQAVFSAALTEAAEVPRSSICNDTIVNQDVIIRAVTQGWTEVSHHYNIHCPLWDILRLLDLRMFRYAGVLTRFCTLFMIHRMLLCLVGCNDLSSLPAWYRPRPTQKLLAHPVAVDVLPWPGLRERACLDPNLTCSNRFWNDVIYCFRFFWPYSAAEAVQISPKSRLFSFSDTFRSHVEEIGMWTMDHSFFDTFPSTTDDILPACSIASTPVLSHISHMAKITHLLPLTLDDEEKEMECNEPGLESKFLAL